MRIAMIVAVALGNNAIGKGGDLCYHIKEDMQRFKDLTMGHPVVMGRKTADSLSHALRGRRNIVLSKGSGKEDFEYYPSLHDALGSCLPDDLVFIIGGERVYKEALPLATTLYVTEIDATPEGADTFFPPYHDDFVCVKREQRVSDEGIKYDFTEYVRKEMPLL